MKKLFGFAALGIIAVMTFAAAGSSIGQPGQSESEKILEVKKGKKFEITKDEPIVFPPKDWYCTGYDKEYLRYLGTEEVLPSDRLVGSRQQVFTFKALKKGNAQIELSYCEVDEEGKIKKVVREEIYKIVIK
jgi:hypothetical protein